MLGVSLRKFQSMRPILPTPVVLGPRAVRWKTAELRRYVEELVGAGCRPEPPQLAAARRNEETLTQAGDVEVEGNAQSAVIKGRRGVGQRAVPSNRPAGTAPRSGEV